MKIIHTAIIFDKGGVAQVSDWRTTWETYTKVIQGMVNPPGSSDFKLRAKTKKPKLSGSSSVQWYRNGVPPIRAAFQSAMKQAGYSVEFGLKMDEHITGMRKQILTYPDLKPMTEELHSSVGDIDFAYQTPSGFKSIIEWETGNISSSHRALNKMCLALMANLADAAVLVVPSAKMYPHLTDRIGNWRELCPYFAYLQAVGAAMVEKGLLAITVVEHDELVTDESVPYLEQGPDGNSATGRKKVGRSKKPTR